MQSVAIPTTPSWRILNMPPPITSASTWPSTRSTRMLWSMFALRPEIPKMSGQYPLISTRPIRTPESWLSPERKKTHCCDVITRMMKAGAPVFNLRSAFPYLINNSFPTPCHQCVVIENGKVSTCGRCIDVPNLCDECGYFFVAEYTLLFKGNPKIILEMLTTYLRYI